MDWARDNSGLSDKDLDNVFKYEDKSTTVVRMLAGEKQPIIWSLEGKDEWEDWIQNECPQINCSESGLVLILAKRTGERSFPSVKKVQYNDWLKCVNEEMPGRIKTQRTMMTISSLSKELQTADPSLGISSLSGQRSVRTLPFSKDTFQLITSNFYTHSSIARVVSRADIPLFSSAEIQIEDKEGHVYPAYVYNCRTSNAWDMDLALTATYFPQSGLTFAILFGCPLPVEEEILRRLSFATAEASHPLLMPGIFAELERNRQVPIVETTIDEIETRIFELDFQSSDIEGMPDSETKKRNQAKRSAWLDTTYLRNGLVSWNTQLAKIHQHADELKETIFKARIDETREKRVQDTERAFMVQQEPEASNERLRRVGDKISGRIQGIIDEYDDKIRDCTMRVEGMAMATQWALGETNVEIALSTGRDSRHMRSIAIVTMVFLPGTFFATVFSMTFFNWFGTPGKVVSSYFWIYIVITVFFTLLTLGCWWYFITYRPSRLRKPTSEEEIPLV
ncbi:hypothetical protein V8E51_011021 [Hyaloscypha variabilis]